MKNCNTLCLFIVCLLLISCGEQSTEQSPEPTQTLSTLEPRANIPSIEETYARMRSQQVRDVDYTLSMDLTDDEYFSGTVQIAFELQRGDIPLTIDFDGGEVIGIQLNGQSIAYEYNDWFISIDSAVLNTGRNDIEVEYTHPYSNTGSGLYRFTDPVDGREYVYTDFEPYNANNMFPSFDQPDIKASYSLDVIVPDSWEVISSTHERDVVSVEGTSHWFFPQSARFSTYIFSLHAGEYAVWESDAGDIPLQLFARQSLQEYVIPEDWFEPTREGFTFYEDYFGVDYPFEKYDQVIVPDFNAGAMENVAAVTFTENLIKRGEYTRNDKDRINSIILHEMAHMWFGDLVTMRWWNGLWLNESFATYMSYMAEASDPENDRAWLRFFLGSKLSAYRTDEQVTNHPIELPVDNSQSAFANFDGITYGKGASVLKQLSFLLGEENFRQGVSNYLKEKSYKNSELGDFTQALAAASGKDLEQWTEQWLYQKGLNNLDFEYQCQDEVITSMVLKQSAPPREEPIMREHRIQIALYSDGQVSDIDTVTLNGSSLVVEAMTGRPCPDFVYPNHDDHAYIKVMLPDKEFSLLTTGINNFQDHLVRAMLWRNLWEAVRDARMPLSTYANIVLDNITSESNTNVLRRVFGTVDNIYDYYYKFGEKYTEQVSSFGRQYEQLAWRMVNEVEEGGDLQKFWYDSFVRNVNSEDELNKLASLLNQALIIDGLVLDQDRRWTVIEKLAAHDYPDINLIQERELEQDPSNNGRKAILAAMAAAPDLENKLSLLAEIQDTESPRKLADKRQIMRNLQQPHQAMTNKNLLANVLLPLARLEEEGGQDFIRSYSRSLISGNCEAASVALLENAIDDNLNASLSVRKSLLISLQEDQRCIDIKLKDSTSI